MARLITYGADGAPGDTEPSAVQGTFPTDAAAAIAGGSLGRRVASDTNASARALWSRSDPSQRRYYARVYFRMASLPTTTVTVFELGVVNSGLQSALTISNAGVLTLVRNSSFSHGTTTIGAGGIHVLEVMWMSGANTSSGEVAARLNGTVFASATGVNCGTNLALTDVRFGLTRIPSSAIGTTLDFDGLALNDDQGASDNTWPGPIPAAGGTQHQLTLSAPVSASATRRVSVFIPRSVAPRATGTTRKAGRKALFVPASALTSARKRAPKAQGVTVAATGTSRRGARKRLAAGAAASALARRRVAKRLAVSSAVGRTLRRAGRRMLSAGTGATATQRKAATHRLDASASVTSAVSARNVFRLILAAAVNATGGLRRRVTKNLSVATAVAGTVRRSASVRLDAVASVAGSVHKRIGKGLSAALGVIGALVRRALGLLRVGRTRTGAVVLEPTRGARAVEHAKGATAITYMRGAVAGEPTTGASDDPTVTGADGPAHATGAAADDSNTGAVEV